MGRWCTLSGLKLLTGRLVEENASPEQAMFAVQVLQLLVRSAKAEASWIEDDLQSVVPPLATLGCSHRVPLVRLGSLQALTMIIKQSFGHLTPFRKQIEAATRKA